MKSIWLFLFLFCSTIQAAKENVKREIKEDEIEESESIDEEEVEGSGSIPVQKLNLRKLDDDQKVALYSALYWGKVKGEKLHVPGNKNISLNAVCKFFDACKKSGKLTGDPEKDALLIEPNYAQTKRTLSTDQQKHLPKCEDIVTAIRAANNSHEAVSELLKSFLGRKNKPLENDVYSAVYLGKVKGEKLHVPGYKNNSLNAVCKFFDACKKSLTGNPEKDAQLIGQRYAQTKSNLSPSHQKELPKCERIVTAIRAANNRREEGTAFEEGTVLLKSLLGRKSINEDGYSALYWGKIVENKDLNVTGRKNKPLNAVCKFFDACKTSLTGDPETDALLIEQHYTEIKSNLSPTHQDRLPKCEDIVTAIRVANNRRDAGTELLKSFLGRKNAQSESIYEKEVVKVEEPESLFYREEAEKSESIYEKEVVKVEEPEALFYEEEPSSVKIKQEPLDQPGYILKKEAELDQIQ